MLNQKERKRLAKEFLKTNPQVELQIYGAELQFNESGGFHSLKAEVGLSGGGEIDGHPVTIQVDKTVNIPINYTKDVYVEDNEPEPEEVPKRRGRPKKA